MLVRKWFVRALFCAAIILSSGRASVATTQSADDYYDFPLANITTLPNILVFFDVSGSTTNYAYPNNSYSSGTTYFGMFSDNRTCNSGAGAMYSYDSGNNYFYLDPAGGWSGNFLNYATMQEIDVAKIVFTGGVTYPLSSISGGVASYPGRNNITGGTRGTPGINVLIGSGPPNPYTPQSGAVPSTGTVPYANPGTVTITVHQSNNVNNGNPYFTASYTSGSDATKYSLMVKKDSSDSCESANFTDGDVSGVIQRMRSAARWGLAQSNVAGGGNNEVPEPIIGTGYSQTYLASVDALTPNSQTVFAKAYYDSMLGYYSQMQSIGAPAPIDAAHFAAAINLGEVNDPYFYANTEQKASCAKSYILVLTDGNANGAWNASVMTNYDSTHGWNDSQIYQPGGNTYSQFSGAALFGRTTDIRPDLPGNQTVATYLVQMFAQFLPNIPLMETGAQAGGFNDSNGNNVPDLLSEYASQAKTYTTAPTNYVVNPVPNNYFLATDGSQIETEIMSAINSLLKQAASATAVSVLSTSANGAGSIYQAFFVPSKTVSINSGSVTSVTTTTFTNTGTTTATSTSSSFNTSTARTTSTAATTTTATSTTLTISTTTSTSTLTGANDSGFTCPAGDTCSSSQIGGSGSSKVFQNIDYHPTTSTSHTSSTATSLGTSTVTSRNTSTVSSYSTSTSTAVTTGTGTNTNTIAAFNTLDLVWLGDLMQLSVDANGALRDVAGNCIGFSFDTVNFVTNVQWFALGANGVCTTTSPSAVTPLLSFTAYNWNAGPQLLAQTPDSRTIFTSIGGVATQFTTANDMTLCKYMNVDSYSTCAASHSNTDNLINWVRGQNVPGYRDRTYDNSNNQYKLGDILHSTPTVVGAPQEDYNLLYKDSGFATYFDSNVTRQRVVFAGANDGMLHAFDAGSFSGGAFSNGSGNEIWAYVPYNLLPHLQWLADPTYGLGGSHIEYVDSKMKVTDVNFGTTASPNWKTVLLGGMRLGGGKINKGNKSSDNSLTYRSAYFAIDITVPTAPVVLWEVNASNWGAFNTTPSALGFTMSYPAVAKVGDCFYAVVGSGPKVSYVPDYDGNSDRAGSVFVININSCSASGAAAGSATGFSTTDAYSYFSDPIAVDITLSPNKPLVGASGTSYGTDVLYIGETYSTTYPTPNPNGSALRSRMWRLVTNNDVNPANWKFGMLYTTPAGAPISAAGAASSDYSGNIWLFWGTGRLLSAADQTDVQSQAFYGVKEPCWRTSNRTWDNSCLAASVLAPSLSSGNLVNVTGTVVTTTGAVSGGGSGSTTFSGLTAAVQAKAGWYFTLTSLLPGNAATERAITKPSVLGGLVLFSSFIPNNSNPCAQSGSSFTYAVYYLTGTASPVSAIGTYASGGSTVVLSRTATASTGMASNIALHSGTEKGVTAFIQMSTGEVVTISAIPPITAKSGIISWREL
ncbi:MAG: hypothetical protein HY098_03495 [Nitrospinae bacterium]|nr:hypothetical protein [Nitrospinota bacterium]